MSREDTYVRRHISKNGVKESLQNQTRRFESFQDACILVFGGEVSQLGREEHTEGQRESRHDRGKQQDERNDAAQDIANQRDQRPDLLERQEIEKHLKTEQGYTKDLPNGGLFTYLNPQEDRLERDDDDGHLAKRLRYPVVKNQSRREKQRNPPGQAREASAEVGNVGKRACRV